ncbi:MAG TPA: cytoplasmic protein [Eubacteriaceae bacterium]|nr:cytoplasmic protein [Eubacteriaceae bacterium]
MKKVAFFAFRGEEMCFVHVLLNALDLVEKGHEAKIVFEGESVKLVETLEKNQNNLYLKAKEKGIIDAICKACSAKMGVLEFNETVGIKLGDDLKGHPSMESYMKEGYEIIAM